MTPPLIPAWPMPDAQPGGWCRWTHVSAGHDVPGGASKPDLRVIVGK